MADRHEVFQVTCQANTPLAAPVEIPCGFDPGIVLKIDVRIAAGHSSKTGIQVAVAHQPVIPYTPGAWITGDNREKTYDVGRMPHGGQWSVFAYNTDAIAHYWELTFHVNLIRRAVTEAEPGLFPIAIYDIHRARDLIARGQ